MCTLDWTNASAIEVSAYKNPILNGWADFGMGVSPSYVTSTSQICKGKTNGTVCIMKRLAHTWVSGNLPFTFSKISPRFSPESSLNLSPGLQRKLDRDLLR